MDTDVMTIGLVVTEIIDTGIKMSPQQGYHH
jgi:hypothetical protein